MQQKLIKDLSPGETIIAFFVVRNKIIKEKKSDRELYITFDLGDSSGRIRSALRRDGCCAGDTHRLHGAKAAGGGT